MFLRNQIKVKGFSSLSNEMKILFVSESFKKKKVDVEKSFKPFCGIKYFNLPNNIQYLIINNVPKEFTLVTGSTNVKVCLKKFLHFLKIFFKVHKDVLIYYSTVFDDLSRKKKLNEKYEIPDFSNIIVQIAANFLYCQKCEKALTEEEVVSLYHFADKYDFKELKVSFLNFYVLYNHFMFQKTVNESIILTPTNFCNYITAAVQWNCDDLVSYFIESVEERRSVYFSKRRFCF